MIAAPVTVAVPTLAPDAADPGRWRAGVGTAARYGAAAALVLVANFVTRRIQSTMGESISPLFFAAVALAAGFAGIGPGLLATALAGLLSAVFYPNPPGTGLFWWDDLVRVCVFLMVAVLISSLAHLRRAAPGRPEAGQRRPGAPRPPPDGRAGAEQPPADRKRGAVPRPGRRGERPRHLHARRRRPRDRLERRGRADAGVRRGRRGRAVVRAVLPGRRPGRGEPAAHLRTAAAVGRHEDEGWRVRRDGSRFWANAILTALADDARRPAAGSPTSSATSPRSNAWRRRSWRRPKPSSSGSARTCTTASGRS